jgi:signal peptidase II
MARNRLIWAVTVIGTALILLVQYCIRVSLGSRSSLETVPLLLDVLHLTYLRGNAASFGLVTGINPQLILIRIGLILLVTAVISWISWLFSRSGKEMMKTLQFGIGLILAGAISNTVEQVVFNENAVFIDVRSSQLPVFNFADVFLYLGQVISVISLIFLGVQFAVRQWQR